jgi:hypothetical protein
MSQWNLLLKPINVVSLNHDHLEQSTLGADSHATMEINYLT